jgi:hypothetical protein
MRSVTRYVLTLTACVLLALPTGWCCLFTLTLPATAPAAAKVNAECCGPCCPQQKHQEDDEAPTRAPMTWCCCENLVSLRDDGPAKVTPDLAVAASPALNHPPVAEYPSALAAPLSLSPPRPLHVLRCLWLC